MNRAIRITIGVIIWTSILVYAGVKTLPSLSKETSTGQALTTFMVKAPKVVELKFQQRSNIRIGDPIFVRLENDKLVQIGCLRQVSEPDSQSYKLTSTTYANATFFASAPELKPGDFLTYHKTPSSMDWVARFLLPQERRELIARKITKVYQRHSDEILERLVPVLEEAWSETSVVIRDEILMSLARHRPEFEALGARYRIEIVEQELIPILSKDIWPIVRQESQPLLEQVGEQIWKEASVWRFGWRALYDATPLPEKNLTKQEFSRFVENQAVPVLQRNLPKFVEAQEEVLAKIVNNPAVQQALRENLNTISEDPELRKLLLLVLRESIIENIALRDKLVDIWRGPEMQQVLALADSKFEGTVVEIGEEIFGTPYKGVTPEFARILRHKILLKDNRWFVLHRAQDNPGSMPLPTESDQGQHILTVIPGESTMENPFYYPAKKR